MTTFRTPSHHRALACLGAARRLNIDVKSYSIDPAKFCLLEIDCNGVEWDIVYQNAQHHCPQAWEVEDEA